MQNLNKFSLEITSVFNVVLKIWAVVILSSGIVNVFIRAFLNGWTGSDLGRLIAVLTTSVQYWVLASIMREIKSIFSGSIVSYNKIIRYLTVFMIADSVYLLQQIFLPGPYFDKAHIVKELEGKNDLWSLFSQFYFQNQEGLVGIAHFVFPSLNGASAFIALLIVYSLKKKAAH